MNPLKLLADNHRPSSLANHYRRKRFALLRSLLDKLPRPLNLLDVGGEENFWSQMGLSSADGLSITLLNLEQVATSADYLRSVSGDARSMPEFEDKQFDVVFSNSVIEHVGGFEDQSKMAAEVQRIGRAYFVQTPARNFPIEPHFLFPFFAVLPDSAREFLVMNFRLGWYPKIRGRANAKKFLAGFQLLNEKEFRSLFPRAQIEHERVLGLTKSYLAFAGFDK